MSEKVGFVGLGVMGAPMAGHLASAGFPVVVWNRAPEKREQLRGKAEIADTLRELARQCRTIILCVGRTEDVQECLDEILAVCEHGTLLVDHSTISPVGAVSLHKQAAEAACSFVDAPITGGSVGAKNGTLTIFCGGDPADIERATPFLRAYGKRIERVGGPGAGQLMKAANQIAVGGAVLALTEAMAFAQASGMDLAQTRELLMTGAAGSWAFEHYGPKILDRDWSPGFSAVNQRKDFRYCREAAAAIGLELPGVELVDSLLKNLEDEGRGGDTTVAIFDVFLQKRGSAP